MFEDILSTPECHLNIFANVLCPHDLFEFCLVNQLRWLLAGTAENQGASALLKILRRFL